ncbi:MAG: gamma-mobile-trio recombinase GmtY [Burkholderiales bacterium]
MPFVVVNGKAITDNTGAAVALAVLLSPEGPIRSLIDYCLTVRRSISWREKLVRAVKLFLEYLERNAVTGEEEWRLFRNFANALRSGTIDPKTRIDPSGLYWSGLDVREANLMIASLTEFFDWLGRREGPRAAAFNPVYAGNRWDQHIDKKAYDYRRNKAFLGHTWSDTPQAHGRVTRGEMAPKIFTKRPPMFPEDRFEELLLRGFRTAGRYDYRGMLITLLLFGGGLRVSEPFHLYMADVQPYWEDPTRAFVAVNHPSLGIAPNGWKNQSGKRGSRAEYLSEKYGLTPRHQVRGKLHAGWKHPALDDRYYMQVQWLPSTYGQWFLQVWVRYLEQVASLPRDHPYAFINVSRSPIGGIYTIASYLKALEAAVDRIGLTFGKAWGTTAHGPRHAYAQRARQGGIHPVIIQRMMHHCSPDSQKIYTEPELKETAAAIETATQRLATQATAPTPINVFPG